MSKWQAFLKSIVQNSDDKERVNQAMRVYEATSNLSPAELASYVSENDSELRSLLRLNVQPDDFQKEYYGQLLQGQQMFSGTDRYDITGNKQPTLDDYMEAYGVKKEGKEYTDDQRSAFTNPENSAYWGNYPKDTRYMAGLRIGNKDYEQDLQGVGADYQRRNQIEGWGANNELHPVDFAISSLKGFATPRIKEAQLAGREVQWEDVAGDLAELGFNFVPGLGIVSKSGKIIAKVPSKLGQAAIRGAGYAVEQPFVPVATELMDSKVLYSGDQTNPRSQFEWSDVGAKTAGVVGAKGAIKGGASMAKSAMEQSMGNQTGGGLFQSAVKGFERIGEKTDDLLARRQAMLDRKAELASKRANVTMSGDVDIPVGSSSINDLIDAENYRILREEADRIRKSNAERAKYRTAVEGERAARDITVAEGDDAVIPHGAEERVDNLEGLKKGIEGTAESYKKANEAGFGDERIVQLPDGRFVSEKFLFEHPGEITFPSADYSIPFSEVNGGKVDARPKAVSYKYEAEVNPNEVNQNPYLAVERTNPYGVENSEVSRNKAVREQILKSGDDALIRKMEGGKLQTIGENARDIGANAVFNKAADAGYFGARGDLKENREKALRNKMLSTLRPMVADSSLDAATKKRNLDAVMNVMNYGMYNIPKDIYEKDPETYKTIASLLGYEGWKHSSEEEEPEPTTSYSSSN